MAEKSLDRADIINVDTEAVCIEADDFLSASLTGILFRERFILSP
jgi:hypothetical protein